MCVCACVRACVRVCVLDACVLIHMPEYKMECWQMYVFVVNAHIVL